MENNLRLVALILNFAYLIVVYFRQSLHDQRVLYADHVAINALKSVILHAGIFLSTIEFLSIMLPLRGIVIFYIIFSFGLVLWWLLSRKVLKLYRNRGFNYRKILIVGNGPAIKGFVDEIIGDLGYGYKIAGILGCDSSIYPEYKHGNIEDIGDFISGHDIDEIYCSASHDNNSDLTQIVRIADKNAIDLYFIPQFGPYITRKFSLVTFGNVPVLPIRPNPSQNPINRFIKRTFDIVFSLSILILSPLIFIPVAIAIKCGSKGPVFFKQKRTGYRGKAFNCYKFRTMTEVHNDGTYQVKKEDPNVTRVGRFLRHYNIDELPQLVNVLKGDMSIVGPRPHMTEHTEMYRILIDKYMVRHTVKPGITGWAQVLGYRGQTDELWKMEKRVECDVWYAENWNFLLDMKIILLTIYKMITGDKNAY